MCVPIAIAVRMTMLYNEDNYENSKKCPSLNLFVCPIPQ